MPYKKNKRKARQAAQPKPDRPRVGIIAHTPHGGSGAALAMAVAMALPSVSDTEGDKLKMRLAEYYTPEEADMWLCSPHPQLEGQRPIDLMARGDHGRVFEILDRLDSAAHI